jgi:hypothetical protein
MIRGVPDLTHAQNERLRRAMRAFMDSTVDADGKSLGVTEFARMLGIRQPSLTKILSRGGGASYATAKKFAQLRGRIVDDIIGPEEPRPGEDIHVESQRPASMAPASDLLIGDFTTKLGILPGLAAWIGANGRTATVSEVMRAVVAYETTPGLSRASDGAPREGWGRLIEHVRAGLLAPTSQPGDAAAVEALERSQHPTMPKSLKLPKKRPGNDS